jgi:hypothetical protein
MTPPVMLNVYGKFAKGGSNTFITTFRTHGYKHKKSAYGGDDTASCALIVNRQTAEALYANQVGNTVRLFIDDPITPIFEGLISRITYEIGSVVFTRGIDEMMNRIKVTFYNADSALARKTEETATINSLLSQEIYGVKSGNLDSGVHFNNVNKTRQNTLATTLRQVYALPQVSTAARSGGGVAVLIEIIGFYHLWEWEHYVDTSNAIFDASVIFTGVACGSRKPSNASSIYEDNTITGFDAFIQTNASFQMAYNSQTGQSYDQYIRSLIEIGDGTKPWVAGITPTDFNRKTRRVYYRAANTSIQYTYRALSSPRIYDLYGRAIDGWRVQADAGIRVVDVLTNNVSVDDPTTAYLESIEYDHETQAVVWQSGDDQTIEGAMRLRRYYNKHGARFGAPVRQLV